MEKQSVIAVRKLCFIDIARCRPQLTTCWATKAQKAQSKFMLRAFCAFCAFLWLSAVLHTWLGVFLEEVADVDREALQFFIKGLPGS
jgi:hypothetical protein